MDKADLAGKGGTLICSMDLTHERIQTVRIARGACGNHESHCKPPWVNHYLNFNEDIVVILLQALDLASLEFFRAFGRMKKYSGLMLLQTFAEVGLVAYFVLAGFGLFGAVISLLISRGIVLL